MLNSFEKLTQKSYPAIQFPLSICLYKFASNADTQFQHAIALSAQTGQSGLHAVSKMDTSSILSQTGI